MASALLNNRYRILRTLGRGGFGETFLAEDTHMPSGRPCVIKQLKPAVNVPQMTRQIQERFQREAAVLEKVGEGSTQIPKLFAYFTEAGQFYLVQEWIEGQTLTDKVRQQGPLRDNTVRDILLSLLPVLEYIHSQRMVHRDIKPDNIIIRQRDSLPVLIDFGAVKEAMTPVANQANENNSMVIGTPGFMPPEQAAGRPTYSSDLYALGLTAIYLLTEKLPQEFQTDPQTGEILWHPRVTGISGGLSAVIDKAVQSHPRDRYSTAREMLDALQSGASVPVSPGVSNMATVAVAPGGRGAAAGNPQVPVVTPSAGQGQQRNPWLIGGLVAAGIVGAVLVGNAAFNRNSTPSSSVSSSSQPPSDPPSQQPSSPTAERSDTPRTQRTPEVPPEETSPEPVRESPVSRQTPSQPVPDPTLETPSQPIPPSPVREQPPSAEASPSRRSEATPPSPIQFPPPAATPENNNQNTNSSVTSVPAFPVGTSRNEVEASLGKPSRDVSGLWRTRALVYNYAPDQVDLGYLFDRNSGRLRQTEVGFAPSVDPQVMVTTLDGLLNNRATEDVKQGLRQVQQRRRSSYRFTTGSYRGLIVRQECDLIYMAVWEADLHDFDVAGAKKC